MIYCGDIKQNTAKTILLGQLFDFADSKKLLYDALGGNDNFDPDDLICTLSKGTSQSVLTLTKTGGDNDMVLLSDGMASLELTAANLDTVGDLIISFRNAVEGSEIIFPCSFKFKVVAASVYDALYGSGNFEVNLADGAITAAKFDDETRDVVNKIDRRNSTAIETLMKNFVGYHKFDEISGTTILDSSGNNYHGESYRDTSLMHVKGIVGGALQFDSNEGDYITTYGFQNFKSVAFRMKIAALPASNQSIFGAWIVSGGDAFGSILQITPDGSLVFTFVQNPAEAAQVSVSVSNIVKPNVWIHVGLTLEPGENNKAIAKLYIDGELTATGISACGCPLEDQEINLIGAHLYNNNGVENPDAYFDGIIDEFIISANYTFSLDDVLLLFHNDEGRALESTSQEIKTQADKIPASPAVAGEAAAAAAALQENLQGDGSVTLEYLKDLFDEVAKVIDTDALEALLIFIQALIIDRLDQPDQYFDKTKSPWELVKHKKGDKNTEYSRQKAYDKDHNAVTSTEQVIVSLESVV